MRSAILDCMAAQKSMVSLMARDDFMLRNINSTADASVMVPKPRCLLQGQPI